MPGGDNEKHKKGQHELGLTIQSGGRRGTDSRQAQKGGQVKEEGGREKYSSGADNHRRRGREGKEPRGGGFVRNA